LCSPHVALPVEVHVTLARPAVVSQRLDFAALVSSSRWVNGPAGEVRVLDAVLSAVYLAYHGEIFGLARHRAAVTLVAHTFDGAARARFDAYVKAERRDGPRLASAVAAADAIAFDRVSSIGAVKRYIAWAEVCEDLPRRFALKPTSLKRYSAAAGYRDSNSTTRGVTRNLLRCWIRNLMLLPMIARVAIKYKS
jgi:hypothetical protein